MYTILFCPFTWVVWYLNTFFSFDRSVWSILSFVLAGNTLFIWWLDRYNCSISRHTRKTWIVFSNTYFFGFFYFGTFIRKTDDEIDLDLFSFFTVYSVSVPWVDLDLYNDLDLCNDLLLSDLFLIDLSFLLLDTFGLSVLLTVSILFVAMGWLLTYFTILGLVSMSLIPSLGLFSIVETNGFLGDMILMLDFLYTVCYKTKLILPENFN